MAWQKPARFAIAIFVVIFVAIVVVALRHRKPPTPSAAVPQRQDKDCILENTDSGHVESSKDGNTWSEAPRQGYNYFLNGGGFGAGSTQVRITAFDGSAQGATLIDTLPDVQAELEVSGQAQFQ